MSPVRLLALACVLAVGPVPSAASGRPVPASPAAPADTSVAVDSARVAVRRPPDTLLARFRGTPAYDYDRSDGWTWWRDLKRWVGYWLAQLFGAGTSGGGPVLKVVFYAVLALVVGYTAYVLVQLRSEARAPGRTAPETVARPRTPEEMRAVDYEARLEAAVAEEDYRRAVRLLYQQTLQRLDRAGALAWRPTKTNRAYVHELDAAHRSAFATLTRLFERVWYGGAAVDEERFAQIRSRFASFWARERAPEPDDAPDANGSSPPASQRAPRNAPAADRPSA
jgi:hypothetical protein